MSKLAVILHGIVGGHAGRNGLGDPIDFEACAKTIKHNIISPNNADVFIHSWSVEHEKAIIDLYHPKASLFEPQEFFGYNFDNKDFNVESNTLTFRVLSRYHSMDRALKLRQKYEQDNNIKYDWVIVVRFDLVVFTLLDLSKFGNVYFYLCDEPCWPDLHTLKVVHDIVFLSNPNLIDTFSKLMKGRDNEAHTATYGVLFSMFEKDLNQLGIAFKRYKDMEIYRLLMHPEQNLTGHQFGALECKLRLKNLLEEIDGKKRI